MKSIDKLREFVDDQFVASGQAWLEGMAIAGGIEAEIAENYMRLPVDAEGVPIHVGDAVAEKPFRPKAGEKPAEVVCMLLNSDGWAIGDCDPRGHWFHPMVLEHVKPDPLKELLCDMIHEYGSTDALTETVADKYAERIRELMKEGGE